MRYAVKRKLNIDRTEVCCEVCGKIFKGLKALRSHNTQIHAQKINPTGKKRGKPVGTNAWNYGLNKETDDRVLKNSISVSEAIQQKIKDGTYARPKHSHEFKQKTSERMSLNNPGGRCKWYTVSGKRVQGLYEKQFAEALDTENLDWIKIETNNHLFRYEKDGLIKSYSPDFYIKEYDLYVEIKGFWWGDDERKMQLVKEQHDDKRLVVIFGKNKLDIICNSIRELLPEEPLWSW